MGYRLATKDHQQPGHARLAEGAKRLVIGARAQAEIALPETADQAVGRLFAVARQQAERMHAEPGSVLQRIAQPQPERQAGWCLAQLQAAPDQRVVVSLQRGDGIENGRRRGGDFQLMALAELVIGQQPFGEAQNFTLEKSWRPKGLTR